MKQIRPFGAVPFFITSPIGGAMARISDYETIDGTHEDEMTLKGSRFIGIAMPCTDEDSIQRNLDQVSARYRNATHYCWAAVFNGSERRERSSDNGEPSGTAGKPILSVVKGTGLTDIMVVVVRYFGGTLLGTGGLVHAYSETSKIAVGGIKVKKLTACAVYTFTLDYQWYSVFEAKCRDLMAKKPDCSYSDKVDVRAWIPIGRDEEFEKRITDLTERHVRLSKWSDEYINGR